MTEPLVVRGHLFSPFRIFFRHAGEYSDADILAQFGLDTYQRASHSSWDGRHALLSDAQGWTMLADDLGYTLWYKTTTRPAIEMLGRRHETYACCRGDCDESFEYVYYQDGQVVREYEVNSSPLNDRIVENEWGTPLPCEVDLLQKPGCNVGLELAEHLGIRTRFTVDELRIYVPSDKRTQH